MRITNFVLYLSLILVVIIACKNDSVAAVYDVVEEQEDNDEDDAEEEEGNEENEEEEDDTDGEVMLASLPNIVLIYADDLGWTDLGVQGSNYYESPVIDKLAGEGMSFTQAYAGAPNCAPSRACLISGLYTPRHGVYTVKSSSKGKSKNRKLIPIENTSTLDPSFYTLPQMLKDNGYATCMAGKWHLSEDPIPYGFDANFGGLSKGHPKSYFSPYNNPKLTDGPDGEHLPDRLSTEVSDWMIENADNPFFVYLPFYSVHTPLQAREDLKAKYDAKPADGEHNNSKIAAMIESMDEAVEKVLNTIEELNIANNTIVIFTSDNGPAGGSSYASPLRGTKGMVYEGGIRVPFFVKWPGAVAPGTTNESLITQIDLFPTLLEIVGQSATYQLDGQSMLSLWKGGTTSNRSIYWHFPAYLVMNASDRGFDDAHDPPYWRATPCGVIRKNDWKLIEYFETGEVELFNLVDDPGERNDLSDIETDIRKNLFLDLYRWRDDVSAPVPTELNPDYNG